MTELKTDRSPNVYYLPQPCGLDFYVVKNNNKLDCSPRLSKAVQPCSASNSSEMIRDAERPFVGIRTRAAAPGSSGHFMGAV